MSVLEKRGVTGRIKWVGAWERPKVLPGTPGRLGVCGLVLSGSGEGSALVHAAGQASRVLL